MTQLPSDQTGSNVVRFYGRKFPEYRWLSNFYEVDIRLNGQLWRSTEAYYQAAKSPHESVREEIRMARTPADTKRMGQACEVRRDWDKPIEAIFSDRHGPLVELTKDKVMFDALSAKFRQHHDLEQALLDTWPRQLIEASPTDYYWGEGRDRTGKNKLGRMLQWLRYQLKRERLLVQYAQSDMTEEEYEQQVAVLDAV